MVPPTILDGEVLDKGLTALITSFASNLSTEFSVPMISTSEIKTLTSTLCPYFSYYVSHKLRRSRTALDPDNLEFAILRSRNPAEEYKDEKGKYVKGVKKWYQLVLHETGVVEGEDDVQILAEGEMKVNKAEVLIGFDEALNRKNEKWALADKEIVARLKSESRIRNRERKKAEEREEEKKEGGGKMEATAGKGKGKGKEKVTEPITIDDDLEEEE